MYQNKTALITGASSGIGKAIAEQLAAKSCHLILVARRLDKLNELKNTLIERHPDISIEVISADLSLPNAAQQLHQRLESYVIDILVNNAGFGLQGPFLEQDLQRNSELLQLNIIALTELSYLFGRDMKERGSGDILLLGSLAAYLAVSDFSIYAASKAYVLSLGESLHQEFKQYGINVTVLSPGGTETEFSDVAGQRLNKLGKSVLMSAEDCAAAGLKAMAQKRTSIIPGASNKLTQMAVNCVPRKWRPSIAEKALKAGMHNK